MAKTLSKDFFNKDAVELAQALLGKVICHHTGSIIRRARIIETEAYYIYEKGSHASLGMSPSRKTLFMEAGTIYMYYSRGGDSLNICARGEGNAVLIKSGTAPEVNGDTVLAIMQRDNPVKNTTRLRDKERLCSGQTLLCKSLDLKVKDWNGKTFNRIFYIQDTGYIPKEILNGKRLGIPMGRDEHLPLRFIDAAYIKYTTKGRV